MMTVWDLDPERAGTTQQKIDCHVWSRPTLLLALWLCDLLAQSLQLGSISLYIADKNHLPVWPLPWATTGISPVKRFRSRGAEVASKVESHWGCSSKKPTGLMRIKTMGCLWAVHWLSRPHTCTEIHGNRYPRAVGRPGPAQPVQSRSRGGAPPVTGNTSVPGLSLCEGNTGETLRDIPPSQGSKEVNRYSDRSDRCQMMSIECSLFQGMLHSCIKNSAGLCRDGSTVSQQGQQDYSTRGPT